MADKPTNNKNRLSFKDFHTTEYKPGEDESVNYRAYRRKRTDEGMDPSMMGRMQAQAAASQRTNQKKRDKKEKEDMAKKADLDMKAAKRESHEYSLDDLLDILSEKRGYKAQSLAQKRKGRVRAKVGKTKHKMQLGRKKAMRRMANQKVLKRRARRQEWRDAFKKLAKGKKKSQMSDAQIQSIEKRLERPVWQRSVNRKSVIGVKDKRRLEIARKKGTWKK